jgi:hypothetical protein
LKNGVALLAYAPAVRAEPPPVKSLERLRQSTHRMDYRIKSGNDETEKRSRDASLHPSFANHHAHEKDGLPRA